MLVVINACRKLHWHKQATPNSIVPFQTLSLQFLLLLIFSFSRYTALGWENTSVGTLQLKNRRLIGCLLTATHSARLTRYSVLGSAGKVQI